MSSVAVAAFDTFAVVVAVGTSVAAAVAVADTSVDVALAGHRNLAEIHLVAVAVAASVAHPSRLHQTLAQEAGHQIHLESSAAGSHQHHPRNKRWGKNTP